MIALMVLVNRIAEVGEFSTLIRKRSLPELIQRI